MPNTFPARSTTVPKKTAQKLRQRPAGMRINAFSIICGLKWNLRQAFSVGDFAERLHREETMEASVRKLFERYERFFNKSLKGDMDMEEVASLYASDFIAASPAGVMTGKNDDHLKQVMMKGYERYRTIGTKEMRIRDIRISPIDEHHCLAHVAWTATFARKRQPDAAIDFDVHYFVQRLDGAPKVFGWASGDEQALLKEHGIV